jgi:hypothetical protein
MEDPARCSQSVWIRAPDADNERFDRSAAVFVIAAGPSGGRNVRVIAASV